LLLDVILLDTGNMDASINKGRPLDQTMINVLTSNLYAHRFSLLLERRSDTGSFLTEQLLIKV
jgi:hypothetical protein